METSIYFGDRRCEQDMEARLAAFEKRSWAVAISNCDNRDRRSVNWPEGLMNVFWAAQPAAILARHALGLDPPSQTHSGCLRRPDKRFPWAVEGAMSSAASPRIFSTCHGATGRI